MSRGATLIEERANDRSIAQPPTDACAGRLAKLSPNGSSDCVLGSTTRDISGSKPGSPRDERRRFPPFLAKYLNDRIARYRQAAIE